MHSHFGFGLALAAFTGLPNPASAQGGATSLVRPVILGYSNTSSTNHDTNNDQHKYLCDVGLNTHPDQFDGKKHWLVHSVSPTGDLSHEGGARWVLDVRVTVGPGPEFNALIATPETVATAANPTWYYAPAADDPVDRILLDATSPYRPQEAKWATRVVAGKLKVAFAGSGPVGGVTRRGLFVGSVAWDSSGPVGALHDITLVAEDDVLAGGCAWKRWKWGTASLLVFTVRNPVGVDEIWLAEVGAIPAPPVLWWSGVSGAVTYPAVSRDGRFLAYLDSTTAGRIHVRELASGATSVLAPPSGSVNSNSIRGIEWSPDDQYLVFSAGNAAAGYYMYQQRTSGGNPTKQPGAGNTLMTGLFAWRR